MIDEARPIWGFFVNPDGSNRWWLNLRTRASSGTPYCSEMLVNAATLSMRPPMVEPSLAMVMNISPGVPSSNRPMVR